MTEDDEQEAFTKQVIRVMYDRGMEKCRALDALAKELGVEPNLQTQVLRQATERMGAALDKDLTTQLEVFEAAILDIGASLGKSYDEIIREMQPE